MTLTPVRWLRPAACLTLMAAVLAPLAAGPARAQVTAGYSIEFELPTFPFKKAMNARFRPDLDPLVDEISRRQEAGDDVTCSLQIYREAHWLVNYTPDAERAKKRIADLEESLKEKDQSWALEQAESDGSWGACYDAWFFRLQASVDPLKRLQGEGQKPKYPLKFLQPVNEPKKLTDMLEEMKISDIDAGEANRRRELNMVVTAMGQLLFLDYLAPMLPADYPREQVAQGLRDYMDNDWQNKDTGYWGAWYLQNGELVKTDDLSVTFHIISYRRGDVKLLDQLVDTTFSLRETKYPYGWQDRGTTNNHHNYDVTTILKYGWPAMDYIQKSRASAEIGIMLARSLRLTLDGQGRFYTDAYDNVGDAYYFGVSFLDAAGYFDPSKRFWARKLKFPESPTLKQRLIANMQALDSEDPMILLALQKLGVDTTSNGAAAADDPGSSD